MEKILLSSNLYSHPQRLLEDHLIGVSKMSLLFLNEKPKFIKDKYKNLIQIIGLCHDIGKSTQYFQEYLRNNDKFERSKESNHSLLSSLCAYFVTKELKKEDIIYAIYSFIIVKRHHGNLKNIVDEFVLEDDEEELLYKQINSIPEIPFDILSEKLFRMGLPLKMSKSIIKGWVNDFKKEGVHIRSYLRENAKITNYINLNLLYSLLIDADKSDVVLRDEKILKRKDIDSDKWINVYKKNNIFKSSPINFLREKAYKDVSNFKIDLRDKIYSLNLPTGLGKTITSFSFALKLREEIKRKECRNARIIYSLPFLSIIDQNFEILKDIVRINGISLDTSLLLRHHHLSEIYYEKEENEFEPEEAKILIEGWNSEIIVTTFVQFFHTLVTNRNKTLRKYHRFSNSIVILDEIQSIPVRYWLLLNNLLKEITETLDMYIILVTATRPLIFEDKEFVPLVDSKYYFNKLNRVTVKPYLNSEILLEELAEHKDIDLDDERRYLFIFNTITSAKKFYRLIKKKENNITYLSSHIIPYDRLKRIEEIKNGKYKVVISTQVVEAGVDIDFDVVIRDIAPLDSINQSAGRCNRNGSSKGEMYIFMIKDSNNRKYASYVYDSVLLKITENILLNRKKIDESNFLKMVEDYYLEIKNSKSQDESRNYLEAILKLRYTTGDDRIGIGDFELIEQDYKKVDVFVEINEEAEKIWKEYLELKEVKDLLHRKRKFDVIKGDFYKYVISIPYNTKNKPPFYGEMGYVNKIYLKDYYDEDTGFIIEDQVSVII